MISQRLTISADDCLIMTHGPDPITVASKLEGSLALYAIGIKIINLV